MIRRFLISAGVVLLTVPVWSQVFRNPNDPTLATQPPTVAFVVPTSSATYDAGTTAAIPISGTATAPTGVTTCSWMNDQGGLGIATTAANGNWSVSSVALAVGSNVLTVTCQNAQNIPGLTTLIVTRSGGAVSTTCDGNNNFCLASAAAGTGSGNSCANAKAYSFFNTSGNWASSGAGKIIPGSTQTICGTIAGGASAQLLAFQGNGTSGNPITLKFADNAIVQASYFAPSVGGVNACGGGICAQGRSFVTIDGGTNGIMQNTANGTAFPPAQATLGIDIHNCNTCTVKNLTVRNMYVRTNITDGLRVSNDETNMNCVEFQGSHLSILDSTFDNNGWCLQNAGLNGDTDYEIARNHFTRNAHDIKIAPPYVGTYTLTNVRIHDNDFGGGQVITGGGTTWDTTGTEGGTCNFHQDGLHAYGFDNNTMDEFYFYNNYFHGDWGYCPTGWVFIEGGADWPSGTPTHMKNFYFFNNVGIVPSNRKHEVTQGWFGLFSGVSGTQYILNNTVIGPNTSDNTTCLGFAFMSNAVVRGNVISNCGNALSEMVGSVVTASHNYFGSPCLNGANCFQWNGNYTGSLAAWKTACGGCDTTSVSTTIANLHLNADGSPQTTSPFVAVQTNLYTTAGTGNFAPLVQTTTVGQTGVSLARSSVNAWTSGAYGLSSPTPTVGCHLFALGQGYTCVDTNAISGSGNNPQTLTLLHGEAVRAGDLLLSWANLVTTTWTTQTITITDNAGNTFTQWSPGLKSYSNPANQWVGAIYYTVASAAKANGYQATCTVALHGGAAASCDDVSIIILRPPTPATTLTEDGVNWVHQTTASSCPCLVVSPNGQTLTTTTADLVILGGNTDAAPNQIDAPFLGLDGDGVNPHPMYYLSAAPQSAAGSITGKWYVDATTSSAGSGILALRVQ